MESSEPSFPLKPRETIFSKPSNFASLILPSASITYGSSKLTPMKDGVAKMIWRKTSELGIRGDDEDMVFVNKIIRMESKGQESISKKDA